MMEPVRLWVPVSGVPDTNAALRMFYGYAYSCGQAAAKKQKVRNQNFFNVAASILRKLVAEETRRQGVPLIPCVVDVLFQWEGPTCHLWDADAWYLPSKWCMDGLRDGGVLRNDRTAVRGVAGLIARGPSNQAGVLIEITGVPS